jgi:hypothetical protein
MAEDTAEIARRFSENAGAYLQAAKHLWLANDPRSDHLIAPTLQCLAYAIELECKAILLREGRYTVDALKKAFGHSLLKLWDDDGLRCHRARVLRHVEGVLQAGLVQVPPDHRGDAFRRMLESLSELHTNATHYALRYPRGAVKVYPPDLLIEAAGELLGW